jgi:hypothetical protein
MGNVSVRPEDQELLRRDFGIRNETTDFAFLEHCDLGQVSASDFTLYRNQVWDRARGRFDNSTWDDVVDDITMQSLEMYARKQGVCDYQRYQPRVPNLDTTELADVMRQLPPPTPPAAKDQVRLVYLISAYKDFDQLQELVRAIHLPQHLIVIHLERDTDPVFVVRIQQELEVQEGLVVLQYGAIIYTTDSLSHVFLQMMGTIEEAAKEADWDYDYIVNLGSNAYPLLDATTMAQKLYREQRRLRLGFLHHGGGQRYCRNHLRSNLVMVQKARIEIPQIDDPDMTQPPWNECNKKSASGLTSAYTRSSVRDLFSSAPALDVLQRLKYSGT